jgi:hypothetical protein
MYLDHPKISATNGNTEPDRIERINRVYGYALALADVARNGEFLGKLSHLHDHKGRLIVVWFEAPTEEEKNFFVQAWNSKVGDESTHVEHEIKPPGAAFTVSPDPKWRAPHSVWRNAIVYFSPYLFAHLFDVAA